MPNQPDFKEYIQLEYKTMADAHFNVSQRVTSFFQYILVIYSAPLIILTDRASIPSSLKGLVFTTISIIGLFICFYISQLRFESLLYARSLNGMRRYYHEKISHLDHENLINYGVLPIQIQKPSFYDNNQFFWIVAALAVINSAYLLLGLYFLDTFFIVDLWTILFNLMKTPIIFSNQLLNPIVSNIVYRSICFFTAITFLVLHLKTYKVLAYKKERGFEFYNNIIGVDIDGVLNKHKEQFCTIYNLKAQNHINPEDIIKIPVSECNIGVLPSDEENVFKQKEYWTEMPPLDGASEYLKKIRNLGYQVHIFTWRPWKGNNLNIIDTTIEWLSNHGFMADKVSIEGNFPWYTVLYSKLKHYKVKFEVIDRFWGSKRNNIKYFVEDDLSKAIQLSKICKYVFLIDHTYNQIPQLPINIIRVYNWKEILDKVKTLP